jgi:hypothetical protein
MANVPHLDGRPISPIYSLTPCTRFVLFGHGCRNDRGSDGFLMARNRALRLGKTSRGFEECERLRVRRGTRPSHACLDARAGLPDYAPGEPAEMSALRVTAGTLGVQRAADTKPNARPVTWITHGQCRALTVRASRH